MLHALGGTRVVGGGGLEFVGPMLDQLQVLARDHATCIMQMGRYLPHANMYELRQRGTLGNTIFFVQQ